MPMCRTTSCGKRASFNFEGEKPAFCKTHIEDGMINVTFAICKEDGCSVCACFNYPGEKRGAYCNDHKKDDMVNIRRALCKVCGEYAKYNFKGKGPAYCEEHKQDGMVDVFAYICIFDECTTYASCNYPGQKKRIELLLRLLISLY